MKRYFQGYEKGKVSIGWKRIANEKFRKNPKSRTIYFCLPSEKNKHQVSFFPWKKRKKESTNSHFFPYTFCLKRLLADTYFGKVTWVKKKNRYRLIVWLMDLKRSTIYIIRKRWKKSEHERNYLSRFTTKAISEK